MATKRGRSAALDCAEHFQVLPSQPVAAFLEEVVSRGANQVTHPSRIGTFFPFERTRASSGLAVAL